MVGEEGGWGLAFHRCGHPLPEIDGGPGVIAGFGHKDQSDVVGFGFLSRREDAQPPSRPLSKPLSMNSVPSGAALRRREKKVFIIAPYAIRARTWSRSRGACLADYETGVGSGA